jgi:hypothetical protein
MESWNFERHLDNIRFRPQTNRFLDVWKHEVGDVLLAVKCGIELIQPKGRDLDVYEGVLDSETLSGYLSDV